MLKNQSEKLMLEARNLKIIEQFMTPERQYGNARPAFASGAAGRQTMSSFGRGASANEGAGLKQARTQSGFHQRPEGPNFRQLRVVNLHDIVGDQRSTHGEEGQDPRGQGEIRKGPAPTGDSSPYDTSKGGQVVYKAVHLAFRSSSQSQPGPLDKSTGVSKRALLHSSPKKQAPTETDKRLYGAKKGRRMKIDPAIESRSPNADLNQFRDDPSPSPLLARRTLTTEYLARYPENQDAASTLHRHSFKRDNTRRAQLLLRGSASELANDEAERSPSTTLDIGRHPYDSSNPRPGSRGHVGQLVDQPVPRITQITKLVAARASSDMQPGEAVIPVQSATLGRPAGRWF